MNSERRDAGAESITPDRAADRAAARGGEAPAPRRAIIEGGVLKASAAHFLAAMVLLLVVSPFMERLPRSDLIEAILLSAVLASAVLAVGARRRTLAFAALLALPALASTWSTRLSGEAFPPEAALVSLTLFSIFVTYHMLRFILLAPSVGADVICAGIATFLTIGLTWALVYELLDRAAPGSFTFADPAEAKTPMRGFTAMYFSLGTMTTGGFGDIMPRSGTARMLAIVEQLIGVFYMALLIARLVTLYAPRGRARS
ncbi:MAG TPA: potassium channel family protein [Phycisphaerales bacterium]|nr:potassium channel family protein [Phycisphaerales bacterium]HMP36604.1 potassium channel family protein [Phycisphaerales bacterium]